MSRVMTLAVFSSLCVSGVFALDEYMPVPFRMMQIDMGFERTSINGFYDNDGKNNEVEDPDNPTGLPIQGKFGVIENLEGSMAIDYIIQDSTGKTGLNRPVLALKYADPGTGAGGFLAVSLPVGFEEIMNAGNFATMTFGALYGRKFPHVNLLANASYSFNTEDDKKSKMDNLRLFVKPEYPVPAAFFARHKQHLGLSLAFAYEFHFNQMVAGEATEGYASLLQVAPGVFYTFNRLISLEMAAPISVMGENQPATQRFRAQVHLSLDEGLYNAL